MKFSMVAVVSLGLVVASALADEKATPKSADAELKDVRQKASYGLGLSIAKRIVVTGRREVVRLEDLPPDIREPQRIAPGPGRERRPTVSDDLYKRLMQQGESFWTAVYPLYMQREITRGNVREIVGRGLQDARGNYKIVARLFNMEARDYKKFLNFLRKHECQVPFREYR